MFVAEMEILDKLKRVFPEREGFSDAEIAFAARLLSFTARKTSDAPSLPSRFVELGGVVLHEGHWYRCIESKATHPSEACCGCDIARLYRGCGSLQCSKFDRRDGRNVWYIETAEPVSEEVR